METFQKRRLTRLLVGLANIRNMADGNGKEFQSAKRELLVLKEIQQGLEARTVVALPRTDSTLKDPPDSPVRSFMLKSPDLPLGLLLTIVSSGSNPTRKREGARGRSIVAYLARVVSGCMVKGATRHFRRSPMVMSQASIRIEGQLGRDMALREMIEKLKTDLSKKAKKKYFITIAF